MTSICKNAFIVITLLPLLTSCTIFKVIDLVNGGKPANNSVKQSSIPFSLDVHPILIKAKLNDSPVEYTFVLDTGALCMVSEKIAKELRMPEGVEVNAGDSSGNIEKIRLTSLNSIRVGDMKVEDCAVGVFDFSNIFTENIAGIIGSNFLRHFSVTLDYQNKILTLSRDQQYTDIQEKGVIIPFKTDMEFGFAPSVQCRIEKDIAISGVIDTGAVGLMLPHSVIEKTVDYISGDVIQAKGNMGGGMFGENRRSYALRLHSLTLGDYAFTDMPVISHSGKEVLLIGNIVLSHFMVTLNYPEQQMILTPQNTDFPSNIPSYGVSLAKREGKTVISGVWAETEAEKNGLKPGIEVLAVNSEDVTDTPIFELMQVFLDESRDSLELHYRQNDSENRITLKKEMLLNTRD